MTTPSSLKYHSNLTMDRSKSSTEQDKGRKLVHSLKVESHPSLSHRPIADDGCVLALAHKFPSFQVENGASSVSLSTWPKRCPPICPFHPAFRWKGTFETSTTRPHHSHSNGGHTRATTRLSGRKSCSMDCRITITASGNLAILAFHSSPVGTALVIKRVHVCMRETGGNEVVFFHHQTYPILVIIIEFEPRQHHSVNDRSS